MGFANARGRWCILLWLAMSAGSGCASWDLWPWGGVRTDVVPGITPPGERMAMLKQLSRKAAWARPEEQESIAAQLAAVYREESDRLIRAQLVRTLSNYPTASAEEVLKAGLSDPDPDVRIAACQAWSARGKAEAGPLLAEVLGSDTDADVRLAAAESLGELGHPSAVSALGGVLEDRDPAMQYRAVASLRKVTGKDLGNDVNRWREYVKTELPEEAKPVSVGGQNRRMF